MAASLYGTGQEIVMHLHASGRLIVWAMLAIGVALLCEPAFAQPAAINPLATCDDVGVSHRIAVCIRESLDMGAARFIGAIEPVLRICIALVMTLAIIVYGIALSFGMVEKVGRDTMVLVIKLACVVSFVSNSGMMLKWITIGMDDAAAAVVSYSPASGPVGMTGSDYAQAGCVQNMVAQRAGMGKLSYNSPWLGIDCMLDTVIGIKVDAASAAVGGTGTGLVAYNQKFDAADPTKENITLSRGLINFLFSSMQTSILGAVVAIVGFFFIYGFITLIIRSFFTYIGGYMGVTFLVIVSPLFIPLILFKETKQYFDKWTKMLISFAIQPIISLLFVVFSLTAIDMAAFSGDYSVMYRIAGTASRQNNFDLNSYLTTNKIIVPVNQQVVLVKGDKGNGIGPSGLRDAYGGARGQLFNQCSQDPQNPDTADRAEACASNYPVQIYKHGIDWNQMAATRNPAVAASGTATPAQAISREITASILFACMVVFILKGLVAVVPMIAQDVMGDFAQTPNLGAIAGGTGGFSGRMSRMTDKLSAPLGVRR
ncbi:MAG: type IV secretion system protein [Rickettsiales bacterium]